MEERPQLPLLDDRYPVCDEQIADFRADGHVCVRALASSLNPVLYPCAAPRLLDPPHLGRDYWQAVIEAGAGLKEEGDLEVGSGPE